MKFHCKIEFDLETDDYQGAAATEEGAALLVSNMVAGDADFPDCFMILAYPLLTAITV